jgi:signal transduction histidine kinase
MAGSAIEECDRLLDMINTMLMISKTEAGVDKPVREKVDLANLIGEACALFETTAEDKGLTLDCDIPEKYAILGDIRMLQRMLSNLLDNAIKYTDPGGTVRVSVSEHNGNKAAITITDTGIGISAVDFPHIFERFYRCDRSRSETGTGLGLSLARAIARAHGGGITVVSRPGEGSAFTVTLPES